MRKWEIELVQMQPGQTLKGVMKDFGEAGWEPWFFDIVQKIVFLKRPKPTLAEHLGMPSQLEDGLPPPTPQAP